MSGSISNIQRGYAEAEKILACCLAGERWNKGELQSLIEQESPALLSVLAEGLSDRFERRLCDTYAQVFAEVIAAVLPEHNARGLVARYNRVRCPRRIEREPDKIFVLSRVTLGADIAITSVILDGLRRRFPRARLALVGSTKSYELFAADLRIEHMPVNYTRNGGLRDRIGICPQLAEPGSIVVDPDSRITQLGLVPVCPEESYFFFESRAYGGDGEESLGDLARRWMVETFNDSGARAYIAPAEMPGMETGAAAVSLGVGGNQQKRIPDPFERELLRDVASRGPVVVDAGAGGEEAERVELALDGCPAVQVWRGSFAGFASIISRSRLYVGYDSAGQHAAAACGIPLVTVFAGAPCERFRHRWRPTGAGRIEVVHDPARDPGNTLRQAVSAIDRLYS